MRNNIPMELRALPQWVCAADNKVPLNPRDASYASVSDPATWATFEEACRAGYKYVGFMLAPWDPYTIIDLDNKPEKPCTEEQWDRHQKILMAFDSYTERSASKTGYHIIVKGKIPAGVHRDNVEVYCSGRYMICTGDVVRQSPIVDFQPLLDTLYGEMKPQDMVELVQVDGPLTDEQIIDMAMRAANGDKFNALCAGDMTGYPSQSEADFALLSIIAFYTQDNEQCRRLFRMSALGKREKAVKNNTYLNFALGKIRANQAPPVDASALVANAEAFLAQHNAQPEPVYNEAPAIAQPAPQSEPQAIIPGIALPPGLVGELAQYIYSSAIRPVPEIALAAAIALVAGIVGRSYNISGTGLNQYIILLAQTGRGKEGAQAGIENLIAGVRAQIPMADQFMGPAAFASGQALVKVLNDRPCFVSVLGEFGLTLQQLSDVHANASQVMLKKVLLDLYAKSGWNRTLRSSVYSDAEKNTKVIQAPNVTILGESTPETFFDGLDSSHVAEGLIPRFSIIEYDGDRPARNRNANHPAHPALLQRFSDLIAVALTTTNNNTCAPVQCDHNALMVLDNFDARADAIMNSSRMDVEVQLWNRAHLKALKLAALLAVGVNPHQPIVTGEIAQYGVDFVTRDVSTVAKRFQAGDVGRGDSKQYNDLKRVVEGYFKGGADAAVKYGVDRTMFVAGLVPYSYLSRRTANMSSFKHDRLGATNSLKRTIQNMVEYGALIEVGKLDLANKYKFNGTAYGLGSGRL